MIIDRVGNVKKGILAGIVYKIISIFVPFCVQTTMIHEMGISYVGLQGVFSSILSVLNVAELGIGSAIVYSMYEPIAKDDNETMCALLLFYKRVYRIVGGIILLFGLALLPFLKLLVNTAGLPINVYVVFLLYLLNTTMPYFLFSFKASILHAYQNTHVISVTGSIVTALMGIIQIVILKNFRNYYFYLLVAIFFTFANNLILAVLIEKLFPSIKSRGKISEKLLADIKKKVKGLLISKVCGVTRNAFDSVFLSAFLGLAVAGIYSNYFYVMNAVITVLSVIYPALLGGVGNSIQLETTEKNFETMSRVQCLYMLVSGWCTVCLLCLYQPFMKLWAGEKNMFSMNVVVLLVISFYLRQMGNIRGVYSDAAGLFWENRYRNLAEAIANLVLNYLFVVKYGVKGVIMSTNITIFFMGFLGSAEVLFRHYFKKGFKEYLIDNFRYLIVTLFVSISTYGICILLPFEGIIEFIVRLAICCTFAPLILGMTTYIVKKDRLTLAWFKETMLK